MSDHPDFSKRGSEPARWNRVMLKVSGEAFAGDIGYGIDGDIVGSIARTIAEARRRFDVSISVVVGGGTKPVGAYGSILDFFCFWCKLRRSSECFLFSGIKGFFN